MSPQEMERLTGIALQVARMAGALQMEGYRNDFHIENKGRKTDLVTEYDHACEDLIRRELGRRTPELAIVGEEGGGQPSGPTWYCDPIDGTTNFVHGHPFFACSIGLMDEGKPLLGAVVAPALGTEWHGWVQGGTYHDQKPCRVSRTVKLADALVSSGFSHTDRETEGRANLEAIGRILPHVRGFRRCGSAALDLCFVAEGVLDAYWERHLSAWDMAAGAAMVLAAGGRITSLGGGEPDLTRGYMLASNGTIHDELLSRVNPEGGEVDPQTR